MTQATQPHATFVAVPVLLLGFALTACNRAPTMPPLTAVDVRVIEVTPQPTEVYRDLVGEVRGSQEVEIRSRVSGVLQALREVSNALVSTDKVREVIRQNEIRTEASREVLRLQRMRYRAGVVSYLEVLDAERQLFSAEIEQARSKLDQLRAYVELYRALGGGWSEQEIERLLSR